MIRRAAICVGLIVCSALSGGCVSQAPAGGGGTAAGALSAIDWVALAGTWTGPSEYRVDLVTFSDRRNGNTQVVRYDTQLGPGRLVMVAQTPLGLPLYEATVAAGTVETVHHVGELEALPIERILADFVLANWPLEALTPAVEAAGYTLLQDADARRLLDDTGRLLVEIHPLSAAPDDVITVSHHDIPLEISIRTVERSAVGSEP